MGTVQASSRRGTGRGLTTPRMMCLATALCSTLVACATGPELAQAIALEADPARIASTVTYSTRPSSVGSFSDPLLYKTSFDELVLANPELTGFCTDTVLPAWSGVSSQATCHGPGGGFASRTRVELTVPPELAGNWQIQVRPDYGLGGVVFLDNTVIDYTPNNIWQGLGQIFQIDNLAMSAGSHVLEAYGVEDCCDGANDGLYMSPGGSLQPFQTTPAAPCPTQGYAPSCTPQCRAWVAAANAISDRALAGETHFDRAEYLTLFAAVECRTGVPASVLKAIATSEGLATFYEDLYPRQFIEPCEQSWTLGGWGYPQLFSRYYGSGWPVLAFDAPASFQCNTTGGSCSCPPEHDVTFTRPPPPSAPRKPGEPPPVCTTPPPSDHEWATVWPAILHVTLGDDRRNGSEKGNESFGLGIMQVTFAISNIVQPLASGRATYVGSCYPAAAGAIFPFGGTPAAGTVPLDPLPNLELVATDPQLNILLAAELILYKAQFGVGTVVRSDASQVAGRFPSDRYGTTLAAGPHAPQQLMGANSWSFQGAQYKTTNSCTTTECVQAYIETVLSYQPNPARDAGCFKSSPGRTKTAGTVPCLYPVGHRFALELPPQPPTDTSGTDLPDL